MNSVKEASDHLEEVSTSLSVKDLSYRVQTRLSGGDSLDLFGCKCHRRGMFWFFWPEHLPAFFQHADEVESVEISTESEHFIEVLSEEDHVLSGGNHKRVWALNKDTKVTLVQARKGRAYAQRNGQKLLSAASLSTARNHFYDVFTGKADEHLRALSQLGLKLEYFSSENLSGALLAKNWRGGVCARRTTFEELSELCARMRIDQSL